jgi:hypothetical protein
LIILYYLFPVAKKSGVSLIEKLKTNEPLTRPSNVNFISDCVDIIESTAATQNNVDNDLNLSNQIAMTVQIPAPEVQIDTRIETPPPSYEAIEEPPPPYEVSLRYLRNTIL